MKLPTIQVPITPGKSDEKERDRYLQQVRALLNDTYRPAAFTGTSDGAGTPLVLWTSDPLKTNEEADVTAYIRGTYGADSVRFVVDCTVVSVAGVASISSTTTIVTRTVGGESGTFTINGDSALELAVNDNSVHPYKWSARVEVR